jgi:glycosyltransferase involved in cell wall biosynthesis
MKIGVDLRPLQDPIARGVSSYARPLIEEMMRQQGAENLRFFTTGRNTPHPTLSPLGARGRNNPPLTGGGVAEGRERDEDEGCGESIKHLHLPSRLVNFGMRTLGSPTLDGQLGTRRVFMPNIGFWAVGPTASLTVTVHDLSFILDPSWYSPRARLWHGAIGFRGLLSRADRIITLSEYVKGELTDMLDIDPAKIHHIPPGIPEVSPSLRGTEGDEAISRSPRPYGPRDDGLGFPYILFLGVLEKRKNIAGALRAFELAAPKIPNTHFVLAGAGDVSCFMLHASCSDRIHFLGPVTQEKKAALFRGARALFMPSYHEGFGFPPLEAMSAGVPVIASASGALPETIGDAGLLLDPEDTGGFAEALCEIEGNEALRTKLIARGNERCRLFSWERCAKETWDIISTP